MQIISVTEAVGMALGQDVPEIAPRWWFTEATLKKGHIINENDISRLLDIGKKHIYVMDLAQYTEMLHDNEAARRMAKAVIDSDAKTVKAD